MPLLAAAEIGSITSPDGSVVFSLTSADASWGYDLSWKGVPVLESGRIAFADDTNHKVRDVTAQNVAREWETAWGQFRNVRDHYGRLMVNLEVAGQDVVFECRVYDDGVAFRFARGAGGKALPGLFQSTFPFVAKTFVYLPNGEHPPRGPVEFSGDWRKARLPIYLQSGDMHIGLLESDTLSARTFAAAECSVPGGVLTVTNLETPGAIGPVTPWRVLLLADHPAELPLSTLPLNVAAPGDTTKFSWVKPGKCMWDWRVHGYKTRDGFVYGINTASYKRYIDFAAKNQIEYLLIDDRWYDRIDEPDKIQVNADLDIEEVIRYGETRGIGVILYYDRKHGQFASDRLLFETYRNLGAKGVKYGFMGPNAPFTRDAVTLAAEHGLLISFHDHPFPMTGISRTLPAFVTREFCHAQQDSRRTFTPSGFLKMATVNALSGPLDQTNGIYDIRAVNAGQRQKGPLKKNSLLTTVVSETARPFVLYSGLICLPDAPEEYAKKQDLFAFLKHMPATWDESIALESEFAKYISIARRSGEQWFVGSVIDEKGGEKRIRLDFLPRGKTFLATVFEDAVDTAQGVDPEGYRVSTRDVTNETVILARFAPGGGHCMRIIPKEP